MVKVELVVNGTVDDHPEVRSPPDQLEKGAVTPPPNVQSPGAPGAVAVPNELQEIVDSPPDATEVGEADIETVGMG